MSRIDSESSDDLALQLGHRGAFGQPDDHYTSILKRKKKKKAHPNPCASMPNDDNCN